MNLRYWDGRPSTGWVAMLFLAAFVLKFFASRLLEANYAESLFPVPYYVAQLSFDPAQLKAWYATLSELGTLRQYVLTQHIDYLFMASILALHFFGLLFIARMIPPGRAWRRAMILCAALSTLAPLADAAENGISYIMLADPQGFADAWAYLYSSLAALKFAMFVFAYGAAILGILAALIHAGSRLLSRA